MSSSAWWSGAVLKAQDILTQGSEWGGGFEQFNPNLMISKLESQRQRSVSPLGRHLNDLV